MANPITTSELLDLLESQDPEVAQQAIETYFEMSGFGLTIKDDVTVIDDGLTPIPMGEDATTWTEKRAMGTANWWGTLKRHRKYNKVTERYPDLTRAIGEGDSWFLHPFIDDVIDHLFFNHERPPFALKSYAGSGAELGDLKKDKPDLLTACGEENAEYLFYSGGGNDIMGRELSDFLREWTPGDDPARHLNEAFGEKLQEIHQFYRDLAVELGQVSPGTTLVVHGYEYIRPGVEEPFEAAGEHEGKWVGIQLKEKGFPQMNPGLDEGEKLMRYMIDEFATTILEPLSSRSNVIWADTRNSVDDKFLWADEIHPNDQGMGKVARRIVESLPS